MRRKRLGLFIVVSLCSWAAVTYFLFVHCPDCLRDEDSNVSPKHDLQLKKLENDIKQLVYGYNSLVKDVQTKLSQSKSNILLDKIREINLKSKQEQENDADEVSLNNGDLGNKGKNYKGYQNDRNEEGRKDDIKVVHNQHDNISSLEMQMRNIAKAKLDNGGPVIAVIVFSCNRVTVKRCLDQLLKWRPSKEQFPIIVSQDCSHQATTEVILSYGDQLTLIQQPDQSDIQVPPKEKKFKGYFKIARHYGWALNQTFVNFQFDTAIVVEDDLDIASDFFEYFLGTYWLLKRDPTLWCVSAWNDNGKSGLVDESSPQLLYRTDFFPGLGWMLSSSLWAELSTKWPNSYWDDWIRKPEQRKERACIRPELPRTKTFGKIGVSNGLFFEKHLKYIRLNEAFVPFTQMNVSYLLKDNYDVYFVKEVYGSPVVSYQELKNGNIVSDGPVRIPYFTKDQYKKTAKFLGLMDDFRSGVPRTAYRGVVSFSYKGRRVYLAPHSNWKNYDLTWS